MSKPTPGPWEAHGANVFAGKNCIAICDTDNDTQERMEANARLIAAAPELLAALQMVMSLYGDGFAADAQAYARAAIARATGAA